MNRTETAYAWLLEGYKRVGDILYWEYNVVTLRIGNDCRYTPDFLVLRKDLVIELHEVKGSYTREDALVKIKAAAAHFPFVFILAVYGDNKEWKITEVKP
jgi:hypothetical protein